MSMTLLKKMVTKNIVSGKIVDAVADYVDGAVVKLYTVFGQATSYKTGESNYGEWVSFSGTFEAVNNNDDVFRSNVVFIPEPMQSMLRDAIDSGAELVEFGLVVSAKKREDLDRGYEYIISPTIEVASTDALSSIRAIALSHHDAPEPKKLAVTSEPEPELKAKAKAKAKAKS